MKALFFYTLLAIAAIGLGIASGIGFCRYQYLDVEEPFYSGQWDQSIRDQMRPILVVNGGLEHDFGKVTAGESYRYEFILENRGDAPLEIQLIEKSENVSIDIGQDKKTIAASASLPVELTFIPAVEGEQSGYGLFMTNDSSGGHERVRLVVTGR